MRALASLLSLVVLADSGATFAPVRSAPKHQPAYAAISGLIGDIAARRPQSRNEVEELTGAKLELVSENVFRRYEAHQARIGAIEVDSVDYREGTDLTVPSNLILDLDSSKSCFAMARVLHQVTKLQLTGVPSGHSSYGQISFSEQNSWGRLSLGFSQQLPHCLQTLTFSFNRKTAPLP